MGGGGGAGGGHASDSRRISAKIPTGTNAWRNAALYRDRLESPGQTMPGFSVNHLSLSKTDRFTFSFRQSNRRHCGAQSHIDGWIHTYIHSYIEREREGGMSEKQRLLLIMASGCVVPPERVPSI